MSNPLAALPRLSKADQLRFLRYCHYLHLREYFVTPPPVAFALRATVVMFALLFILPAHPLAIPAVIGAGLSLSLILI